MEPTEPTVQWELATYRPRSENENQQRPSTKKITSIVSALWYKHRIMHMSGRRLIRVTRIRLRTGYIFCRQIRVTRISPR